MLDRHAATVVVERNSRKEPLSDEDRSIGLDLLQDKNLLKRIIDDFNRIGVVGEHSNKLVGYLSCVSRKLEKPLAVLIQSSSAAGKSSLMESVLSLVPEEDREQYSALTAQALYYMDELELKHKVLAISEEEGASSASYALKLLQSEGEVKIACAGKDEVTGNLMTKTRKVEGPTMLFMTTTAIDVDEELKNRCLVLAVDESREQTQAIHRIQRRRRTLSGLQDRLDKKKIVSQHHAAQRLLRPLVIINPYSEQLTFVDDKTRMRRDHEKYLTLIDSIALLHQYQREIKTGVHDGESFEYIEVTRQDIEQANELAREVLGRTLDELPPQTRKLLSLIAEMVRELSEEQAFEQSHIRFSRRHVRRFTGWSDGQLQIHCRRLEELEYLLVHSGSRGQSKEYELLYYDDGKSDIGQLMGLIDVEKLK